MIIHSPIISGSLTFADGATFALPAGGIYSGSFSGSISGLGDPETFSASLQDEISQLKIDTGSQDARLDILEIYTSSQDTKNSTLANYSASLETKNSTLATYTASLNTKNDTLGTYTASLETKNSTLATYTASLNTKNDTLGTYTASLNTKNDTLGTYTASLETKNSTLSSYTASLETKNSTLSSYTASLETKNNTLGTYTSSVNSDLSALHTFSASLETKNSTLASVTGSLLSSQTNLNTYTGSLLGAFQVTGSRVNFLGDVTIYGTQSVINSQNVQIADNILYLAPTAAIDNDLGIIGHYNDGTYRHAGIFMDASDGHSWKVFNGATTEENGTIDIAANGFTLADFKGGAFTGTSFTGIHNGTINSTNGVVSGSSQIDHNSTTNYVANRHIDHTAVSITAGNGISGGGDISTTRTITLDTGSVHFTGGVKTALNSNTVVSGSSQIDATATTNFATGVKTQLNANTVVSGSSQVVGSAITTNSVTVTAGTGLSGGGAVALGSSVTLSNAGVTSNVAGTGVSVSGATGAVTISIGQAVATTSNVQFSSLGIGMAASVTAGRIDATNDIVAYSSSDIRFKENITPIENPLEKISKIGGYTYDWKEENKIEHGYDGNDVGVIAQEIEAVLPQLVQTRESGYKAVKYDKLVALLIAGMKEQQSQIEELTNKINKLENGK